GNPVHQPTITNPGSTKMIADNVPAADATVCTMLFSRIDESLTALRIAIEITAAGMDDANVRPALRPRWRLGAGKSGGVRAPRISARIVSSFGFMKWRRWRAQYLATVRKASRNTRRRPEAWTTSRRC